MQQTTEKVHLVHAWHPTVQGLFARCTCDVNGRIVEWRGVPPSFPQYCRRRPELGVIRFLQLQDKVLGMLRRAGKIT